MAVPLGFPVQGFPCRPGRWAERQPVPTVVPAAAGGRWEGLGMGAAASPLDEIPVRGATHRRLPRGLRLPRLLVLVSCRNSHSANAATACAIASDIGLLLDMDCLQRLNS